MSRQQHQDFYIYCYYDGEVPFYIGKGRKRRAYEHLGAAEKRKLKKTNSLFSSKLYKMLDCGNKPNIVFLKESLNEQEALKLETHYILTIGRIFNGTGPLTNILCGEEYSPKRRDNISKSLTDKTLSKQHRANLSKGLILAYAEGRRSRISFDFVKWKLENPEKELERTRKISTALSGRKNGPHTLEHCNNISQAHKGKQKSKQHLENILKGLTGVKKKVSARSLYTIEYKTPDGNIHTKTNQRIHEFCRNNNLNSSSFYRTLKRKSPIEFGKNKGWQLLNMRDKSTIKVSLV